VGPGRASWLPGGRGRYSLGMDDAQLSLIPLNSPALVALYTGQVCARIARIAPQLYPCQIHVLLGELALLALCLDGLDAYLERRWQPTVRRVKYTPR